LGAALTVCVLGIVSPRAVAGRAFDAERSEGLESVARIPYTDGTHLAFTTAGGRDYAFAVQAAFDAFGKLRSIDITDPENPKVVDTIECGFNQGYLDISFDDRTLLMGSDAAGVSGIECLGAGLPGFMTIDISDPTEMKPMGFAAIARGSHGATAHPKKPLVYDSYGDVIATEVAEFEIWSIENPKRPRLMKIVSVPGYHGPHDMTFSPDGKLMVASNVSTLMVFDTSDPRSPVLLSIQQAPGATHTHESRFTPDGRHLVVTDETIPSPWPCPGGGLYFYDVGDEGELTFKGLFQLDDLILPGGRTSPTFCTAHVIGLSADGTKIAASWHGAGVRYIDITHMDGASFGGDLATGQGAKELGWFTADDSETMSAKFYKGPYIYSNDLNRGFEVFKVTARS
jgi:hypothetical protein